MYLKKLYLKPFNSVILMSKTITKFPQNISHFFCIAWRVIRLGMKIEKSRATVATILNLEQEKLRIKQGSYIIV